MPLAPWARVAEILKWEGGALKINEVAARLLLRELKEQIKKTDEQLAIDYAKCNRECKGYTVAARAVIEPMESPPRQPLEANLESSDPSDSRLLVELGRPFSC